MIVGAGICGLLAARELSEAGWRVTVFDKGRGVGGRMATRRVGDGTFDHGAQFFTVREERFESLVESWLDEGVVREWTRGFADAEGDENRDGHPRYRGTEGMTSVPKRIARGLEVRTGERIAEVTSGDGTWSVRTESGALVTGSALLLTPPVPQSLALLDAGGYTLSPPSRGALEDITYSPCLALMALMSDEPTCVPVPGGVQIKGEPLDWIGDNQSKGISQAPAVTVHAGPEWSRDHFDDPEAEITSALLSLAGERLGADLASRTAETSLARWRYSWVTGSYPEPYLVASEEPPLIFAGDAFGVGKVEGAALSGLAAADRLLGRAG